MNEGNDTETGTNTDTDPSTPVLHEEIAAIDADHGSRHVLIRHGEQYRISDILGLTDAFRWY